MKNLFFTALLLAACASEYTMDPDVGPDAGPDAGDDAGADAGSPDATPAALRGCVFTEPACSGENICIENECVPAWNRDYRIWVYHAEVPAHNPDGFDWDATGGAPDLYVSVKINDTWIGQTDTVMNQFSADFDVSYVSIIAAPDALVLFYVADNDGIPGDSGGYEHAFSCDWSLSADVVDDGDLICSGALGTLRAKIEPL